MLSCCAGKGLALCLLQHPTQQQSTHTYLDFCSCFIYNRLLRFSAVPARAVVSSRSASSSWTRPADRSSVTLRAPSSRTTSSPSSSPSVRPDDSDKSAAQFRFAFSNEASCAHVFSYLCSGFLAGVKLPMRSELHLGCFY